MLVRGALWISAASVVWALAVGTSAVVVGARTRSVALLGFGLESGVDGVASAVLLWRFSAESRFAATADRVEDVARRAIGAVLVAVAVYVGAAASRSLIAHTVTAPSGTAILLAAASVLVLPVLSVTKLRLASSLRSRALHADGVLSGAGAALALAVLLGRILGGALGWAWADPVAAMLIAGVVVVEGVRALPARA